MLEGIIKLLHYYKSLGERTFDALTDEQLVWEPANDSNSIAIIVKHLWGNMLSRWTNFLTEDGEKPWRKRDEEFDSDIASREELLSKWNEGWTCFLDAVKQLKPDDLERIIYIRNEGHTVIEALHRQLSHYSYHIGQIVYIGKLIQGDKWTSLSIPKGSSSTYNRKKFDNKKEIRHFTEDIQEK